MRGLRRSRRPRRLLGLALVTAACAGTPRAQGPLGSADRWTFPLIGPLEDGLLLTPITIDGRGPFVFAIDPDANVSIVDDTVVKAARLRPSRGPARVDERGTQQPRYYVELPSVELGGLVLERRTAMIVRAGAFDSAGRRIHGVLGRDVFGASFVVGFERDRGIGHLVLGGAYTAPPGAITLGYTAVPSPATTGVAPVDRRVVRATIGADPAATFTLHLDLGATGSQLRAAAWPRAGLEPRAIQAATIDEVGVAHPVTLAAVSDAVVVGSVRTEQVAFVPYDDRRWSADQLDGTLGLGFLRGHDVWIDWTAHTVHLRPRTPVDVAARIARWEFGAFGSCATVGCLTYRVVDPVAGRTLDPGQPHPGVVLSVTRDERAGGMDLEVVLEARDRPELPRVVVNLPPNVDRAIQHLRPEWRGATLDVVDASPHPRPCAGGGACIDLLAR